MNKPVKRIIRDQSTDSRNFSEKVSTNSILFRFAFALDSIMLLVHIKMIPKPIAIPATLIPTKKPAIMRIIPKMRKSL